MNVPRTILDQCQAFEDGELYCMELMARWCAGVAENCYSGEVAADTILNLLGLDNEKADTKD